MADNYIRILHGLSCFYTACYQKLALDNFLKNVCKTNSLVVKLTERVFPSKVKAERFTGYYKRLRHSKFRIPLCNTTLLHVQVTLGPLYITIGTEVHGTNFSGKN